MTEIETENENEVRSPSGVGPRLCSRCNKNEQLGNSSWCRSCKNEHAAIYRERRRKRHEKVERQCAVCDAVFEVKASHPHQKFCSKECNWASRRRPVFTPSEGMILCTLCNTEKPIDSYAPSRQHLRRSWCRECSYVKSHEWASNNVDRRSAASRESKRRRLLKKYGAPCLDYEELLRLQDGGCAICGCKESDCKTAFHIDHDHNKPESESYRGLLCASCNVSIGGFQDDPAILRRAIDYLEGSRI